MNPQLKSIENKIKSLNELILELKLEQQQKDAELHRLSTKLDVCTEENQNLKDRLNNITIAGALSQNDGEGKKDAKLKINELVREIDRCIALLNK